MKFISTRNKNRIVSGPQAIVDGLAPDGGLYVPERFPQISIEEIQSLIPLSYAERAATVIGKFLDEFDPERLLAFAEAAYGRFDGDPAPVVKTEEEGVYMLELWHGPTHAFKDIALTLLPHLLVESKRLTGSTARTLVLVATSGDTGKAALDGFKDIDGTDIIVFYPVDGVSAMQKLQMITQEGGNVSVAAIKGNFDDAQNAVKRIFSDPDMHKSLQQSGYALSSANSINFGRLVPQIVYYFSAYADLLDEGEIECGDPVDFSVPTGNFGNILAGYYAARMGLPVGRLICASNRNNVLTDFFTSGAYDRNRPFYKTTSPSMDILISSNLERLLFEVTGRDDQKTAAFMADLKDKGVYGLGERTMDALSMFDAGYASEEEVSDMIGAYFDEYGYVMDPHTAVAVRVFTDMRDTADNPTVILSTASPHKFPEAVLVALGEEAPADEFKAVAALAAATALPVPDSISMLKRLPRRFDAVIEASDAAEFVNKYITSVKRKGL